VVDVLSQPLVDVAWLHRHLDDPTVAVVEVGVENHAYYDGHVPGAAPLSWLDDLNEEDCRGVPSGSRVEELLTERGVTGDTRVVLYGDQDNSFAAYAFWVLRYYGHRRLSLLDGGRQAWLDSGAPLSDDSPRRSPARYRAGAPHDDIRLMRDDVLARYVGASGDAALVDCRTSREYHGEPQSPVDLPLMRHRLNGHIPGARNISSKELIDTRTGRLRPLPQLRATFQAQGIVPDRDVGLYCTIGERSALAWFVLRELLGYPRVRLYDGGWAEYGSLVGAPVNR
jgi:thiosulfate/3-mercaptopyruvate sulfurtransferase